MSEKRPGTVFKILTANEWADCARDGDYIGSSDDIRDGFIHLSTAEQVAGTAAKHFRNRDGLVLVALDAGLLGGSLKWERSRGNEMFPHLYGKLEASAATGVHAMTLDEDGIPTVAEDVLR